MRKFISGDSSVCEIKKAMSNLKNNDCERKRIYKLILIILGIALAVVVLIAILRNITADDEYFDDDFYDDFDDEEFDEEYLYDDNDFI